jgi:hypothetical protein
MRYALIATRTPESVDRYLPSRYKVLARGAARALIGGEDFHGWTMDDYVLPRLASGLHYGREIPADEALALLRSGAI